MEESLESYLKELFGLFEKHNLSELRLEGPDLKVRLCKDDGNPVFVSEAASHPRAKRASRAARQAVAEAPVDEARGHFHQLRSPIVGVFYRATSPEAPSFVEPGAFVKAGDVVCLIEAMKVFNEIHADKAGRVVEVLCNNGDVVETDQALMLIDENAAAEA